MHSLRTRYNRVALAVLTLTAAAPALLDAQTGRKLNPRMSYANPDLVAYETLVEDRQELMFYRQSDKTDFQALQTRPEPGRILLPDAGGATVSTYSGDLDWRPVLEDPNKEKRNWYAYAASERGVVRLYVNFIDRNGKVAPQPLQLPIAGGGRSPRWSIDGKHLAYVSDSSILHVFFNVDQALSSRNVSALRPVRIAAPGNGVFFPAWSPKTNYIAYQADRDVRGARRSLIEVIRIDTATKNATGSPVVLTEDLGDLRAYRPSWSKDARYIAFYVDHAGQVSQTQAGSIDIGVVEAQAQPGTGRILRGELLRGQSSRIAEGVFQNNSRGPSWTLVTAANGSAPALVYVQRDEARGNPIYIHALEAWTSLRGRDAERVALAPASKPVNAREASATETNGAMVYTYASASAGGEAIGVYADPNSTWAKGNAVTYTEATEAAVTKANKTTRGSSVPLAFVFPGAGQLKGDHKVKGGFLTTAGIAGAGMLIVGITGTSDAVSRGDAANGSNYAAFKQAQKDFDSKKGMRTIGAGTLGAVWAIGIIDAIAQRKTTVGASPTIGTSPSLASRSNNTNVGVKFPFGSARR